MLGGRGGGQIIGQSGDIRRASGHSTTMTDARENPFILIQRGSKGRRLGCCSSACSLYNVYLLYNTHRLTNGTGSLWPKNSLRLCFGQWNILLNPWVNFNSFTNQKKSRWVVGWSVYPAEYFLRRPCCQRGKQIHPKSCPHQGHS